MYFLNHNSEDINIISHFKGLKVIESLGGIKGAYLHKHNNMLSISDTDSPKVLPISVDFLKSNLKRRLTSSYINSELLNRVLGKKHEYKTVLDATAGMGVDCMLFASLGLEVTAFEKSEVIYLLLKDGLKRAAMDEQLGLIANRVNLNFGNSLDFKGSADVIYLDFMFSKADKKAKSKKDMEIFKKITTIPSDNELIENFNKYLSFKFKRLVFKRPLKSEVLKKEHFSHSVAGKAIRYDIYLPS